MAQKCLLFVYGLLMPGYQPPRSLSQQWEDEIEGTMYNLGEFPAVVLGDANSSVVKGFTIEIDSDELADVDEFEDTESQIYRRVMVETKQGFFAWAYEYMQPIPQGLTPIVKWSKDS